MKPAFRSLSSPDRMVRVLFEDRDLLLPEGQNLAAALLAAGHDSFRETPVSGAPRGPFCMMGACFDCLVQIDGITRQACLLTVTEGMELRKPNGDVDV